MARDHIRIEIAGRNCHHCGLTDSTMTEEKPAHNEPISPYDLWPPNTQPEIVAEPVFDAAPVREPFSQPAETNFETPFDAPFVPVAYTPETPDEAVRQRGLAFSIGVVFFSSVAFMLFLGWLADLILGSSPWGIVVGIILGAVIGFLQFFRITSRIFKNDRDLPKQNPLLSNHDDGK